MKFRLFSEYCGLGESSGEAWHYVDQLCRVHDDAYQEILDAGGDPYTHWNYADDDFMYGLQQVQRYHGGIREAIAALGGMSTFKLKRLFSALSQREEIDRPSLSNLPKQEEEDMMTSRAEGSPRMEGAGAKRKRTEEHCTEPHGHGNTPATGTEQAGYVQKYVPCNFPDKLTVKLKYCNNFAVRCQTTAGSANSALAIVMFRTNTMNGVLHTGVSTGTLQGLNHHPNQFNVWSTLYGYYRVEQFEYRIHCVNTGQATFTETANPPGAATNAQAMCDALVTVMPTQNTSDFSSVTSNMALFEQKQAHTVVIPGRVGGAHPEHVFRGVINPEDYDVDPITTAQDETWTAIANIPAVGKYLGVGIAPLSPYNTTSLLPEVCMQVFVEFFITVQFAGYLAANRQATN